MTNLRRSLFYPIRLAFRWLGIAIIPLGFGASAFGVMNILADVIAWNGWRFWVVNFWSAYISGPFATVSNTVLTVLSLPELSPFWIEYYSIGLIVCTSNFRASFVLKVFDTHGWRKIIQYFVIFGSFLFWPFMPIVFLLAVYRRRPHFFKDGKPTPLKVILLRGGVVFLPFLLALLFWGINTLAPVF